MQERISIEEAIREAGLKRKYVANKLGVSDTYINEYLSNVKEFYKKDENKIFKLIYRLAYENCFLKEGTYYKLLKKFEKSKRNTFNKIKKNKKLKV